MCRLGGNTASVKELIRGHSTAVIEYIDLGKALRIWAGNKEDIGT